ncbi:MAG: HU family DNA-binding protein, partial [Pseudohongiellaceae bacterium]
MNKSELIDAVAASADLPKAAAGRAIDAMLDTITDSLKKDDPVVLVGFPGPWASWGLLWTLVSRSCQASEAGAA